MSVDEFWDIVDRVHAASGGDMDRKCDLLRTELLRLPMEELKAFAEHFRTLYFDAYSWDLWGAAVIMDGGCSDDSFMDFRTTLISMGRKVYERALADAESLVEVDFTHPTYEGYGYVDEEVYEERMKTQGITEEQLREEQVRAPSRRHPKEPKGEPFHEWALEARFPRLAARYGHKDANWEAERQNAVRREAEWVRAARLADLVLDSGIVPSCGLLPPFRVVAKVLRTGRSPSVTGKEYSWEPWELHEGDYWIVVSMLRKLTPEQMKRRPDLREGKVELDPERVPDDDYGLWLERAAKQIEEGRR